MNFAKCRGEQRGESSARLWHESSFSLVWHLPWSSECNRRNFADPARRAVVTGRAVVSNHPALTHNGEDRPPKLLAKGIMVVGYFKVAHYRHYRPVDRALPQRLSSTAPRGQTVRGGVLFYFVHPVAGEKSDFVNYPWRAPCRDQSFVQQSETTYFR